MEKLKTVCFGWTLDFCSNVRNGVSSSRRLSALKTFFLQVVHKTENTSCPCPMPHALTLVLGKKITMQNAWKLPIHSDERWKS